MNLPFTGADRITVPSSTMPIGLKLNFSSRSLLVFNWGDELFVAKDLPKVLVEAKARFESTG